MVNYSTDGRIRLRKYSGGEGREYETKEEKFLPFELAWAAEDLLAAAELIYKVLWRKNDGQAEWNQLAAAITKAKATKGNDDG